MNWKQLQERCYVPYSETPAVCAVQGESGTWYPGVRIENISYPLTITPWQAALFSCISSGDKPVELHYPSDQKADRILEWWEAEYDLQIESIATAPEGNWYQPLETNIEDPNPRLEELLDDADIRHSNFPVSALIETKQGSVGGANIECSQWSLGLCAERVALAKAISAGLDGFEAMHIHTRYGEFSSPCGACRQVIIEHMPYQHIELHHANGTHSSHFSAHLMPFTFKSSRLDKKDR